MMKNPIPEIFGRVNDYLRVVWELPEVNAIDKKGWSIFEDPDSGEAGEINIGLELEKNRKKTRIEIRRVIRMTDEPELVAQAIVGEILLQIDEALGESKK